MENRMNFFCVVLKTIAECSGIKKIYTLCYVYENIRLALTAGVSFISSSSSKKIA